MISNDLFSPTESHGFPPKKRLNHLDPSENQTWQARKWVEPPFPGDFLAAVVSHGCYVISEHVWLQLSWLGFLGIYTGIELYITMPNRDLRLCGYNRKLFLGHPPPGIPTGTRTLGKLLYFVWSPPWHLYILLLANLLAFYLTYFLAFDLAFYLAYLLAFYLAYLLADVLAYLLADVLAYLLAYVLAYLLAFHLAFYLANILALYLAYLLAFHLAF